MIATRLRNTPVAAAAVLMWVSCAPCLASAPIQPSPAAPIVGQMVAHILEVDHYAHHPLDEKTSENFLKTYLDTFDYNRMFFTKADIDEFGARYGKTLCDRLKEGDVSPAFDIFGRFMTRLQQREAWVEKLTSSTFDFGANESMVIDRHDLPWPANEKEAQELWRQRVKYEILQEKLNGTKPADQAKNVDSRYKRLLQSYQEFDSSDIMQAYLTSLTHTFDPHSDYMAAAQKENFDISMRLSLVGIGAVLREGDGYARIVSLVPGGPADKDKRLKPNDKIEAVAQGDGPWVDAVGMKLDRLVELIRGEKGTVVRLKVIPNDAIDPSTRVIIPLVRDEIKLTDQEAKAEIINLPANGRDFKIGVIDLPSFYADMKTVIDPKSTTRDVEKLIVGLKKRGIDGLIMDIRRNGGGSLSEAVALTGLFIPEGPVVQVKDAHGLIKVLRDTDAGELYGGPMIVLTSHASASASEIFSGALQDYGRALVVGEKSTFGKGTVQSIIDLSQYLPAALKDFDPGAVKLTIQKFYRISGGSTQNRGVIPDVQLPSIDDYLDIAEKALPNAMPYDEVEPAQYARVDYFTTPQLKDLARLSAQRVDASREFQWVREDIARYKKQKQDKTISLNLAKRLADKKADEARETERKKERLAMHEKPLVAREITLESLDGTAPPAVSTAAVMMPHDDDDQADSGSDYKKAPPPPDFVLEETAHILADMIAPPSGTATAGTVRPVSSKQTPE